MAENGVLRQEVGIAVDFDWILEAGWLTLEGASPPIFSARLRLPDGQITRIRQPMRNLSSGQLNLSDVRLSKGTLIFAGVTPVDDVYTPGQNFALLQLLSPPSEGERDRFMLASGPLARFVGVTWPGGSILQPLQSLGLNAVQVGNAPAAGANFSFTYPSNSRVRISTISCRLVTDINVANRRIGVLFLSSGVSIIDSFSGTVQVAAQTVDYRWTVQDIVPESEPNFSFIPLPDIPIDNGSLQIQVQNIQVGDQISQINIYRNIIVADV